MKQSFSARLIAVMVAGPALAQGPDLASITPDTVMDHVRALPEARSPFGSVEHVRGLAATETLLIDELVAMGYDVRTERVEWTLPVRPREGQPPPEPARWRNIWVDLPGTDKPGELLLIGAHFDAVRRSPGADDNGSGVAVVLEMARVLRDTPMRRTVRLMFFNLEEVGLIGARHHARTLADDLKSGALDITLMLSVDGVGYFTDEPGSQRSPIPAVPGFFEPPDAGDFIALATVSAHRPTSQVLAREMRSVSNAPKVLTVDFLPVAPPDLRRSDHAPFLDLGVPAMILADTANFRNPHYHEPSDTPETLDADRLASLARMLTHAVHAMAEPAQARGERERANEKTRRRGDADGPE